MPDESVGALAELYLGNILYALELAALSLESQGKDEDAAFYRGIARKLAEAHGKNRESGIGIGNRGNWEEGTGNGSSCGSHHSPVRGSRSRAKRTADSLFPIPDGDQPLDQLSPGHIDPANREYAQPSRRLVQLLR